MTKTKLIRLAAIFIALGVPLASADPSAVPTDAKEVNPVEAGATAPNVALTKADGSQVHLHDLVADDPAVLVFYRGGWCPYCNRHLAALGQIEDDLRELGYRIHAVSMDKPEKVAEAAAEAEFNYALYSDATAQAAKAFGLAFKVSTATNLKLRAFGINLEEASGEDHRILPVPAVFLIGRGGRIDFRYYNPDYKERLSGEALLEAAREEQR